MKLAALIGLPLTFIGLILYCPPVVDWLTTKIGAVGQFGGLVTFAVGWSLSLAFLVYNLGREAQRSIGD